MSLRVACSIPINIETHDSARPGLILGRALCNAHIYARAIDLAVSVADTPTNEWQVLCACIAGYPLHLTVPTY